MGNELERRTLREQLHEYQHKGARGAFRPTMSETTRKALAAHASASSEALKSTGGPDYLAALRLDHQRLNRFRQEHGGNMSPAGVEALDALNVLILAEEINAKAQRDLDTDAERAFGGARGGAGWIDGSGNPANVLAPGDRLQSQLGGSGPGLAEFLRAIVTGKGLDDIRNDLGTTPDSAGGYTVPTSIASEFIDRLRAKSSLIQAGARTFMMESKTHRLVRVTADPTITWRASENAALTPSDPTFGALDLTAKTAAVATKISFELAQDGVNAWEAARTALVNAMALAIDKAGLHGVTNGPAGLLATSGRTQVTSVGNPSWDAFITGLENLAAADVDLERCNNWIMSPRTWGDLQRLKTGITNDNTPRAMPPAIAKHKLHVSSSVLNTLGGGSDTVIFGGDFSDVVLGIRQDITVRVLNERFADSLAVGLLCWARVDWGILRPASIVTLEGVTNI